MSKDKVTPTALTKTQAFERFGNSSWRYNRRMDKLKEFQEKESTRQVHKSSSASTALALSPTISHHIASNTDLSPTLNTPTKSIGNFTDEKSREEREVAPPQKPNPIVSFLSSLCR